MKRFALIGLCVLALAAPAYAINGVGDVDIYADDQGNSCEISAPGNPNPFNVYLVHKFLPGEAATAIRIKVVFPTGMTFFAFNPTPPFVPVGQLTSDYSLGYGTCINTTTNLGAALVQAPTAVADCSYISVLTSDALPEALAVDCNFVEFVVGVGQAIVNPVPGCNCNIATEPTSWGRVKALYR